MTNITTIRIDELEKKEKKELSINFSDYIEGITSKDPIYAELLIKSMDEFIKVTGLISGIATLTCDLCLKEYEYKIDIQVDEMFAKNEYIDNSKQEIEIKENGFVTDLNGENEINIRDLIYQLIILDFPNKKVCDINCKGGEIFVREENFQNEPDPRMSIFKDIKL